MDIDEFREQQEQYREGLRGKINQVGTVDTDQTTLDDYGDVGPMHNDDKEPLPFTDLESYAGRELCISKLVFRN